VRALPVRGAVRAEAAKEPGRVQVWGVQGGGEAVTGRLEAENTELWAALEALLTSALVTRHSPLYGLGVRRAQKLLRRRRWDRGLLPREL